MRPRATTARQSSSSTSREPGLRFFTLYGHLSEESLDGLAPGRACRQRATSSPGWATRRVNGGWPPHLHFQVDGRHARPRGRFPGVAAPSERKPSISTSAPTRISSSAFPADRFPAGDSAGRRDTLRAPAPPRAQPQRLVPPPADDGPRPHAVPVRRGGPPLPGRGQQRAARRPQPPARRRGRRPADGRAQHEHALPAPAARQLRRAPGRADARSAERLLHRVQRQRGQRAGAAPRARVSRAEWATLLGSSSVGGRQGSRALPRRASSSSTAPITATRRRSSTSARTSSTARAAPAARRTRAPR